MTAIRIYLLISSMLFTSGNLWAQKDKVEKGRRVYLRHCEMCHGPGSGRGATTILRERYKDSIPADLEKRTDFTPEMIKAFVRTWIPGMPAYLPTEITPDELDALAAYLTRNNKDE